MTITAAQASSRTSRRAGTSGRRAAPFLQAAVLTVAMGLSLSAAPPARAQAVFEIGPNLFNNIMTQVNTWTSKFQQYNEYIQTAQRWQQQIQQFQSMLSNLQSMVSMLGLPQGVPLTPVAENFMVVERCGGNSGDLSSVLSQALGSLVGVSLGDKIKQQQLKVCVMTQRMRNKQYNEMVAFMTTTIQQIEARKTEVNGIVGSGQRDVGQMNQAMLRVQQTNSDIQSKMKEFEARMQAYDTYIATMEKQQETLTQTALRGQPSILGQVIKTAVLKGALEL